MGISSIVKEKWFSYKRKVSHADHPRTIIFAHDYRAFTHWCHVHGERPNDPVVIFIATSTFEPHRIQGYHFRPKDIFVVLETAPFGLGWKDYVREVLLRTEGWVNLEERKEHYI